MYDFDTQLAFSVTSNGRSLPEIILATLPGVISVEKTDTVIDKSGVDYIATLRRGAAVNIDLKLRSQGCSAYWRYGEEELSLETWSVVPERGNVGKCGWTLDESKATHYTLHVFDPSDSNRVFLLPFQLLRKAFRTRVRDWYDLYRHEFQRSGPWKSECVFVPASVVLSAITEVSIGSHE